MKYIITETQLKLLIKEQQAPIKLNLQKDVDSTKLNNYCKPILIDKKIIDTHIVKVDSQLNEWIVYYKKEYEKKYPEISDYLLDIENILSDIKPIMSSSFKKLIYAKFGHLNYTDETDLNLIFKKIYEKVNNKMQSNLAKKVAMRVLITKKNVGEIKKGIKQFFEEFNTEMYRIRHYITRDVRNIIKEDYKKIGPKCTNVLITNNEHGEKVVPYNPARPPLEKVINSADIRTLLNQYILSINKTIDSFV